MEEILNHGCEIAANFISLSKTMKIDHSKVDGPFFKIIAGKILSE